MDWLRNIRWRPEIGDPSLMGWVTVGAYALVAVTAWLASRRARTAPGQAAGSRGLWLVVAGLMAFLCLNKQLDLQSLVTDIGRVLAWKQGWYQERREFQKVFVMGLMLAAFVTTGLIGFLFRDFWRRHVLLGCGLAFIVTFIVVRAVSFHHFDAFLKFKLAGVRMNWLLELTGTFMIWVAAMMDYMNPKRAPKPPWKPAR